MELKDTIDMMQSADYKERFRAEYYQLKIRYDKLKEMVRKYREGTLGFQPDTPIEIFNAQLYYMEGYLKKLGHRARARIENIVL